jgi:hypothetical protein
LPAIGLGARQRKARSQQEARQPGGNAKTCLPHGLGLKQSQASSQLPIFTNHGWPEG